MEISTPVPGITHQGDMQTKVSWSCLAIRSHIWNANEVNAPEMFLKTGSPLIAKL